MTSQGLGSSSLPSLTGTITGIGVGALVLPKTGSNLVIDALVIAGVATLAMLVSMSVSKLVRKTTR